MRDHGQAVRRYSALVSPVWSVERGGRRDARPVPRGYRMQGLCSGGSSGLAFCVSEPRIPARHHGDQACTPSAATGVVFLAHRAQQRLKPHSLSVGATGAAQACRHAGSWAPPAWRPSGRVTGAFAPAALAATDLRRAHSPFAGPACERRRDQPAGCAANAAAMVARSGVVGRPISLLKVWLSSNRLPPPADAEHCASTWAKPAGSPAWTRAAA